MNLGCCGDDRRISAPFWSRCRGSNPDFNRHKVACYHYTTSAFLATSHPNESDGPRRRPGKVGHRRLDLRRSHPSGTLSGCFPPVLRRDTGNTNSVSAPGLTGTTIARYGGRYRSYQLYFPHVIWRLLHPSRHREARSTLPGHRPSRLLSDAYHRLALSERAFPGATR